MISTKASSRTLTQVFGLTKQSSLPSGLMACLTSFLRIYDQTSASKEPSPPVRPSSGYPGMSAVAPPPVPIRERGYEGYPGFLAWQQLQQLQLQQLQQLQHLQQLPASQFSGLPSGLSSGLSSSIPAVHQPADWSRIRELPGTPSRTRVSYADVHEPPRSRSRSAAPTGSSPGVSPAEPSVFELSSQGVAYPPDSVSAIVERLDQIAPQ